LSRFGEAGALALGLARPRRGGYREAVSESGSRFEPKQPLSVTDVAAEETSDGRHEWCFLVKGLDETVQAARFATRREAEKAHRRFKRAIELLGRQTAG
jgi:hypothetical protein